MNYNEFKTQDVNGLFNSFLSIDLAYELELIPKHLYLIMPKQCRCGSDFIISSNLKTMRCCDKNCVVKMAHALALMLSDFGCKDIGFSTCYDLCKLSISSGRFKIPSHVEVMNLDPKDDGVANFLGAKWYTLIDFVTRLKSTRMTFSEVISKLHIPGFGSDSLHIFDELDSIIDLINLEKGEGIRGYLNRKGVKSEILIKSLMDNVMAIYTFECSLLVPLIKSGVLSNKVCVTGSVSVDGYSLTRAQFIKYCNSLGELDGVQIFTIIESSALMSCDRIIADTPSNTRKYRTGLSRKQQGEADVLVTAQEYVDYLKNTMNKLKDFKLKDERRIIDE